MLTRVLRRSICRLLIGVLVSTQWAIAAYACSGVTSMAQPEQVQLASATMLEHVRVSPISSDLRAAANQGGDTGSGNPAMPNLCVAHCQYGQQSADNTLASTVPAALLTTLYILPSLSESAGYVGFPEGRAVLLAVATDPPHAILHCCLRT